MISGIDRVQITVCDRRRTAEAWERILGAVPVREDLVESLGAERTVLRLGTSEVELLEPNGIGIVAEHVSRNRGGLFTAGLATPDLDAVRAALDARAIPWIPVNDQIYVASDWLDVPGLRLILTQEREREPSGLVSQLYEVTHLAHHYPAAARRLADVFDLDRRPFVPIRSEEYGYEGILTLFDPDRLDRIETITPFDRSLAMGRYFQRRGPRLYMAYVESDDLAAIRDRLEAYAPTDWTGSRKAPRPDNLYIHPNALDGVMIGVSRTDFAWTWSGKPERALLREAA